MSDQQDPPELQAVVAELKQTVDAFDPAARYFASVRRRLSYGTSAMKVCYILAGALLVSTLINVAAVWVAFHPQIRYFAADHGSYLPLVPLSDPYVLPQDVTEFARATVNQSFSLDFARYQADLEAVRSRYTGPGFKSFLAALDTAGILSKVKTQRYNLSSSTDTPVITKEGTDNGVYVWIVQMPLEFRFVGQNSELPVQRFLATLRIERVGSFVSVKPIKVAQIITTPMENGQ